MSCVRNKATRSPEISRQQVQKLTPPPTLGIKNQNKGMDDILDIDSHCPIYHLEKPPPI